jgi:hypothetical protein
MVSKDQKDHREKVSHHLKYVLRPSLATGTTWTWIGEGDDTPMSFRASLRGSESWKESNVTDASTFTSFVRVLKGFEVMTRLKVRISARTLSLHSNFGGPFPAASPHCTLAEAKHSN